MEEIHGHVKPKVGIGVILSHATKLDQEGRHGGNAIDIDMYPCEKHGERGVSAMKMMSFCVTRNAVTCAWTQCNHRINRLAATFSKSR